MIHSKDHIFKQKALHFAATFETCCFLNSHQYTDRYGQYECIIAFGNENELHAQTGKAFSTLKSFYEQYKDWLFGFLSYELKNEVEDLSTTQTDQLDFPDLYFFIPQHIIGIKEGKIEVLKGSPTMISAIEQFSFIESRSEKISIESRFSKDNYLEQVKKIQQHIKRGDIYEVNFCQEFFAQHAQINPVVVYSELSKISPTPFSGFFKIKDKYILSATPERFLCKRGNKLISQPIKGTAKRSTDTKQDLSIKQDFKANKKEQAENVMIVDLVRNDLTKSAKKGTVKVDELFGIYSFPQVYQMISTISCELDPKIHFVDAIKNTFPMGSMTGAPKLRAMQLIDTYENSKRGVYSGSFGYISPNGDFDFNVIIRSILYNSSTKYLSFQVGGAITYQSDPEQEYEECLLKASAIMGVLSTG
ncbi:anthranilate synthase component I family protein [Pedobacter sp. ASV28]|uniref:anthranilate synthase component I family protein n=1 Tax=Pedobacter sp. ASV28 TaxID=2795123 RepID=UPI0018EB8697|nr:anthranilate synthase component I family protein [Pedobacter sp. ASV28]